MSSRYGLSSVLLVSLAFLAINFSGCNRTKTARIGYKKTVSASELAGKSSTQRTGQHSYEFSWTFSDDQFKIIGDAIPGDLLDDLCEGHATEEISGQWRIVDGSLLLELDTENGTKECQMEIFATGPIRIQSSAAQYVF